MAYKHAIRPKYSCFSHHENRIDFLTVTIQNVTLTFSVSIGCFKEVTLVKPEDFADYELSKVKEIILDSFKCIKNSSLHKFLIENYPKLDFNISPSPNVTEPIEISIQLALYSIIFLVCIKFFFGSDRSSRCHNICLSVHPVYVSLSGTSLSSI